MTEEQSRNITERQDNTQMPLRERNKEKKRVAMFKATRELLLSEGYDKTTMEAIAERAEVGVATVYKYFGTKDELVMELVRGDMVKMLEDVSKIVADPPADLADAVVAVLAVPGNLQLAREGTREKARSLVRHVIDEMWHKQGEVRRKFARWASIELQARIEAVLLDFQLRGKLKRNVDVKDAAHIIYMLFDYNYIRFARGELPTAGKMTELTNKQVRILLDSWSG